MRLVRLQGCARPDAKPLLLPAANMKPRNSRFPQVVHLYVQLQCSAGNAEVLLIFCRLQSTGVW